MGTSVWADSLLTLDMHLAICLHLYISNALRICIGLFANGEIGGFIWYSLHYVIFLLNMIMTISQKHWAYLGQGDIMIWYDIDKNDMMSLF